MFTKISNFHQLKEYYPAQSTAEFSDFEEAQRAGMQDACLGMTIDVSIRDAENNILASWQKLDNYWFEYKDADGQRISQEKFFARLRKKIEQHALTEGINIRLRQEPGYIKVHAGDKVIPIESSMLPWVSESIEETQRKMWEREEDGLEPMPQKEVLRFFSSYLINRIKRSLELYPENWSYIRRFDVFKRS